ncbi:AAA family ATPase [Veronia nyctiphanis]|uniref:AAA family ATPase n=1 Tax=Veronia nyctiphanis TaxID=1278244 RepID=UPI00191C4857
MHGASLNVHLGMHTGVFTTYVDSTPEGHVANAALALSRYAEQNQILCTSDAQAILDPHTEFKAHDKLNLGLSIQTEPVFRMVGERLIEAFGFMRGTRNHHELIGREKELETVVSLLNKPNDVKKVVHIHGEAGIGKSRLLQEVRANAASYQHLVAQCLPEHQNNALYRY